MSEFRAAVLFSGIGGWEVAADQLGIDTVWAAEWDDWKRARYTERFPHVALYGDVEKLDGRELVERHGPIDLVCGSPPCTDVSCANPSGRGLDGDESRLYFEAIRLVREIRPRWACFENSDRLRTRGADRVLAELEAAGYACWPLVVAAGHAGAPHIRRRSWLVAADTERTGLRDKPRRVGGTHGQGAAVAENDADTHGNGQSRLPIDAEMGGGTRVDGPAECGNRALSNANGIARRSGTAGSDGSQSGDGGEQRNGVRPSDATGDGRGARRTGRPDPGVARQQDQFGARQATRPCHSDRPRLAEWQGVAGDDGAKFTPAQRAALRPWDHAGESLAGYLRMVDGIPAGFPNSEIRKWRSAFGDAVVIPVVRSILAGILATDAYLAGDLTP